ncbi:MAG: acyltransferase [Acidimicrobiia bacterium]|nr:acyltransferase [Acidimicrobiia bacterium]
MQTMWKRARTMADRTPPERDRYIDFLRLFSIAVVVLGHWLMAVVLVRDGEVEIDHLLAAAPKMQYLTWVLQVMPVFFIVGGFANAVSWSAARRGGHGYAIWLQGRTARLLRPTMILAGAWVAVTFALVTAGVDARLLRIGTQVVAVPLWFLAVYIGVVALAPIMIELDRRFGWAVPAGLFSIAAAVDWLGHGMGVPVVGWTNFLFVWLGIHQLGVLWQRDVLPRSRVGSLALAGAGYAGLVALTGPGPYPVSMVGVPGSEWTNNLPPTIALMMLAVLQIGVMLVFSRPVSNWLERPFPWAVVIAGNGRIMTVYLWHMTAMVSVLGLAIWLDGIGFGIEPLSAGWWWSRPLWFAILLLPLAGLVGIFGQFEENRPSAPAALLGVVAGVLVVMWGFARLALDGFVTPDTTGVAFVPAVAVVAGAWMLGVRRRASQ